MNTNSSSFSAALTQQLWPRHAAQASRMNSPHKTNAAALSHDRLHSQILYLNVDLEESAGGQDPTAAAEPAG